jgi:hypothetical protein
LRFQHDTALYPLPCLISWDWTSPYEICALFVYSLPLLPNFCHHQIVVSITIYCPEGSDVKYTWMTSPFYQNMVSLIVGLSVRRYPSKFMNVTRWEHCTFDSQIFGCVKVYYSNCMLITNLCELLFPLQCTYSQLLAWNFYQTTWQ